MSDWQPPPTAFGRTPASPASPAWSVSALLLALGDALGARFGRVVVRGEVGSLTRAASGHAYFTLKDADGAPAALRAVAFRRVQAQAGTALAEGQQVACSGRLALYEPRGELQLVVEAVQPVGLGALYEAYVRLRAKLAAEGLFDAERKRALPPLPRAVALVTSLAGAALHDVLATLARRAPHVRVVVYPTLVQGREAPPAIVAALAACVAHGAASSVILCRGGGSLEDLWAFNDERVVRAVAAMPLPTVVAVGHESDLTLAELAADLRAATPTAAAEQVALPRAEWLLALTHSQQRMQQAAQRQLDRGAQRIDQWALQLVAPRERLWAEQRSLDARGQRLREAALRPLARVGEAMALREQRLLRALATQVQRARQHTEHRGLRLAALDPRRVLARGYAWMEDARGAAVVSALGVEPGQELRAVWADGAARVRVQQREPAPD